MRVALEKVKGIESVSVTLKRGVAHIALEKGNTVTVEQLRRIVKDAGYSSRDAAVTVIGTVRADRTGLTLSVAGTREVFDLGVEKGRSPAEIERGVDGMVSVTGVIPAPDPKASRERIQVQSISAVR